MIRLCAFADEYSTIIDEQIEGLRRNGIGLLELRNVDGKNVADITEEEAKACYEKLQKGGIRVWSVGSPLGKADVDCDFAEYEKKVRHICRIANIMKTDKIRMFSFLNAYDKREKVLENLKKMVKIASEYGVGLYHENEKKIYGDTVERVLDIYNNVKGLKLIYDPANFIQCGQDSKVSLDSLFDKTDYFHIKDVIADTEEVVPAGYGDGRIPEIISRIDRDVVLTVEPHLSVFEGYSAIDDTQMKHKFTFENGKEAFDFAVASIKKILSDAGYAEKDGGFVKA